MNNLVSTEIIWSQFHKAKPFFGVVFLQFGLAGMDMLSKAAMNEGMSNYVFVVYRHVIATIVISPFAIIFDKETRPKMTSSIFIKIMLLGLLEPVIDQNLYFLGMKYTTATFAAAMCNVLPAITFLMACVCRLERFKVKSIHSQAKLAGTVVTVVGAMLMTLLRGPVIELPWTKTSTSHKQIGVAFNLQHSIKGSIMITIGCISWACFMNLQAITLRTYPAELSLTAWICLFGTVQGGMVALVMEKGKGAVWSINWDTKFLAAVYSVRGTYRRAMVMCPPGGIFCSGIAYYIQGLVMKERGPVFVTAFSPLSMIIVAILSSFIFAERMFLGRVVGAIVIVMGLYLVIWGKKKDYKSTQVEEEAILVKQMTEMDNNCNDGNQPSNHEVINISLSKGEVNKDGQLHPEK